MKQPPPSIQNRKRSFKTALNELAENRTTLVIAHRLATIRNADRIIVVTKEGIAEQGSYDELLQQMVYLQGCIRFSMSRCDFDFKNTTFIPGSGVFLSRRKIAEDSCMIALSGRIEDDYEERKLDQ